MKLMELQKSVHPVAKIPRTVYKLLFLSLIISFGSSAVSQLYCFLLTESTGAVQSGKVVLGIVLYLLYLLKDVLLGGVNSISNYVRTRLDEALDIDVSWKSTDIMAKVSGKVTSEGEIVSDSVLMASVGNYIKQYRELVKQFLVLLMKFSIFLFSVVKTITIAIEQFDNPLLFTLIIIAALSVAILFSYKRLKDSKNFFEKLVVLDRRYQEEKNDCINQEAICEEHFSFMLNNFIATIREKAKYSRENGLKENFLGIRKSAVFAVAIGIVVVNAIVSVGAKSLDANAFLGIISLASVFTNVLRAIDWQIIDMNGIFSTKKKFEQEVDLCTEVMKVYGKNKEAINVDGDIELLPFYFSRENKKFSLTNKRRCLFKRGEVILVRGDSGAGKSTLLDIISGDIDVGNNPKIKTIRYSSRRKFGSKTLLEEITFGKVDKDRLIYILKGVSIYNDLLKKAEQNGQDVIEFLSNTKGSMSTGMEDRLMLARTLYNLNGYDLVLIDEPIGGIDVETARKVIRFIKEYAAKLKNKVVLVTTHQYQVVVEQFDTIIDVKKEGCESIIE